MTEQQRPETPDAEAKPAAPTEWRSPTMLSPEEIEDLRRDAQQSSERMRAMLAARRAKQAADR